MAPARKEVQDTNMIDLTDERILRRFKGEEGPSLVAELAELSVSQRLDVFLELRGRVIRERYGTDPSFQRVVKVIRSIGK
jgi:hypothetical protein